MNETQLLSVSEYAIATQTPEATVRYHIKQGKLKGLKLGRFWYVVVPTVETGQPRGNVLTLFTHAGGAGKTSLVRDIGFQLASQGKKVLLIDADPQANLSTWLGCSDVKNEETLLSVVDNRQIPEPKTVKIEDISLALIPANLSLALAEVKIPGRPLGMFCLRSALQPVQNEWHYILIDSPPSLGSLAGMAALAGQGLIVPVETSGKGLQAFNAVLGIVKDYESSLQTLRQWHTQQCFVRLVVPTKYDARTRFDQNSIDSLSRTTASIPIAPAIAYRPAPYKEAIERRVPIQLVNNQEVFTEIAQVTQTLVQSLEMKEAVQWA